MEEPGKGVIETMTDKIRESKVEPAWLAGKLLAVNIIDSDDMTTAINTKNDASERLLQLLLTVTGNGRPGAFQTFVEIFLRSRKWDWLGEKLKGTAPILVFDCDGLPFTNVACVYFAIT